MLNRFYSTLILVVLYAATASAGSLKILPLGDSLTAGGYNLNSKWYVGSGYREKLVSLLDSSECPVEVYGSLSDGSFSKNKHEGHSGWKIDQIADISERIFAEQKPDVILLMLGTNDIFQNDDLDNAPIRLSRLIDKVVSLSPGSHLFVASIIDSTHRLANRKIRKYNAAVENLVLAKSQLNSRIHFANINELSDLEHNDSDFTDGVHPTAAGYAKIAQAWASVLGSMKVEFCSGAKQAL